MRGSMQIDFHHGVTYCVARIAGFDQEHAAIIAYASQYVDDAVESGLVKLDNGMVFNRVNSAHKTLSYRNFEQLANTQDWESATRHDKWCKAIQDGKFSFGAEDCNYSPIGQGSWVMEAFGVENPDFDIC
jgi:hypothetical protein